MVYKKRVPDRWKDYEPCTWTPIENQRIISFKTPLSKKFETTFDGDEGLFHSERFTPSDLISELEKKKLHLGMVLDFTFTKRYYDPKEFTDQGIIYKKMMCPGHEIPKEQDVKRFEYEVKSFLDKDNTGALVGVHCTHGLNRTGYMVSRYLIDCHGYQPDDAIKAFNNARGYPIERENYLDDLRSQTPGHEVDFKEYIEGSYIDDQDAKNAQDKDARERRKFIPGRERGKESTPQYPGHADTRKRKLSGYGADGYEQDGSPHNKRSQPSHSYQRYPDPYTFHDRETYLPRPNHSRSSDYRYDTSNHYDNRSNHDDRNYHDRNYHNDRNYCNDKRDDFYRRGFESSRWAERPDSYHSSYHGNYSKRDQYEKDYIGHSEDHYQPRNFGSKKPWSR